MVLKKRKNRMLVGRSRHVDRSGEPATHREGRKEEQ